MALDSIKYTIEVDDKGTPKVKAFKGELKSSGDVSAKASASIKQVGLSLAAVGAAATAAAAGALKYISSISKGVDETGKFAGRIGIAVEELTALQYAAQLSGMSTDELNKSMEFFNKTLGEARRGMGPALNSLNEMSKAIGVNLVSSTATGSQMMDVIADGIQRIQDPAERTKVAMELFGRSGAGMITMLKDGAPALRQMTDEARQMGAVFGGDAAQKAALFNDTMLRITTLIQGTFRDSVMNAMPDIIALLEGMKKSIIDNQDSIRNFTQSMINSAQVVLPILKTMVEGWMYIINAVGRFLFGDHSIDAVVEKYEKLGEELKKQQKYADYGFNKKQHQKRIDAINEERAALKKQIDAHDELFRKRHAAPTPFKWDYNIPGMSKQPAAASAAPDIKRTIHDAVQTVDGFYGYWKLEHLDFVEWQAAEDEARKANIMSHIAESVNMMSNIFSSLTQIQEHNINREFDRREQRIKEEGELRIEQAGNSEKAREKARKETEDRLASLDLERKKKLEKETRRLNQLGQAAAIARVLISTSEAMMKSYATLGPIGGALFKGLIAAEGAAQVALISKQKFEKGGFPQGRNAMVQVNENGQEAILNANATRAIGADAINAANRGNMEEMMRVMASGRGGGGVTVNISGGMVDKRFVESELVPVLKKVMARR